MSDNDFFPKITQKCPKMSKNVQKCPKMSKNVQKCPKMHKIACLT
jgi:hypothetical protein